MTVELLVPARVGRQEVSAEMTEETELKLDVSEEGLGALDASGLLGACSGEADLRATYFDTPGLDLWRNRLSLRVRREGRGTLQTIKQPAVAGGGLAVRREWEMPHDRR